MRIGELAGLVGISTRAIRHDHHVGLLPEPARRANGYREYSLRDAVGLARDSPPPSTRTSARPRPPRSAAPST